jgi:hypothetical protein
LNEASAREVVLVRAIETRDVDRTVLTDADREWATRAAAEVEGEGAPPDRFLSRRAALALERVRARHPAVDRVLGAVTWRRWIGWALVAVAFALGLASNQVGPAQRVNVLAFPLLALLAWNLAMYALLTLRVAFGWLLRRRAGPMRGLIARLAQGLPGTGSRDRASLAPAVSAFAGDWSRLSASLASTRAARVLHWAAAAFALGAVAGMYFRGLAFEYRAGWESTFLDAAQVHGVLALALAPGSLLTGLAIPDAAHLEGIRFPASPGEIAAPWIHLYAATTAAVVILPRLLLALLSGLMERRWAMRFPLPLDDAYYARLLRGYRRGAARVRIVPYSFQVPATAVQGLTAVLARVLGPNAAVTFADPVAYGEEDTLADIGAADVVIALFTLAATPERENQSAFLAALASRIGSGTTLVVLIDESAFRSRFARQPERVAEREQAWRSALEAQRTEPVFVDLAEPDLRTAEAALLAILDRGAEPST